MTTVCFKNGMMAADGLISDEGNQIHMDNFEKIRWCDKYLVGLAGSLSDFENVFAWFSEGAVDSDECPEGDWEALVWDTSDRLLKCYEGTGLPVVYPIGNSGAIGSGGKYAAVAMRCGRNAKQAVTIAKDFDTSTGGKVQTISTIE